MNQTSLLSGNIRQQILTLAVPLLLGNILQQLYNTADSLIVGRFLGTNAFASVGISGSLMNLFIFILDGFCAGITVSSTEAVTEKNTARKSSPPFFSA